MANSIKCELNRYKLMFICDRVVNQKFYLKKLNGYLSQIDHVTNDLMEGQIKVKKIEVEIKDFNLDEKNNQTLIYLNVVIYMEGELDKIHKDNPETFNNLFSFIESWLSSFNPYAKKSKRTSALSGNSRF